MLLQSEGQALPPEVTEKVASGATVMELPIVAEANRVAAATVVN